MIPDRFKVRVWNKRHKLMRHGSQGETARGIGVGAYIVAVDYAWSLHVADDEIPMQCTGIRDSTGQLVYEGDVVHDRCAPSNYAVEWKNGCRWNIVPADDQYITVIGNIHENPELMEDS